MSGIFVMNKKDYSMLPSIRPVPVSDQQNFVLIFRAELKIGEELSIPKKVRYFSFRLLGLMALLHNGDL